MCPRPLLGPDLSLNMAVSRSPEHQRLGAVIRELREAAGLSSEGFGTKCGLDEAYIRRVERGEMNLVFTTLLNIASTLGTTVGEITTRAKV